MFTNDRLPRATRPDGTPQTEEDWKLEATIVRRGASIGSNATILCGSKSASAPSSAPAPSSPEASRPAPSSPATRRRIIKAMMKDERDESKRQLATV